jgi:hypothetical protein
MNIEEMHIDFKRKLNKVDSEKYRNFRPQEIDLYLREGEEVLIKQKLIAFETSQKLIDDLRMLLVKHESDGAQPLQVSSIEGNAYVFDLTDLGTVDNSVPNAYKYLYHMRSVVVGTDPVCGEAGLKVNVTQTDDLTEALSSEFYSPSYFWREVPAMFSGNKLYVYSDGTFTLDNLKIDYLKRPKKMANPDAVKDSLGNVIGYNHPDGTPAIQQDCEIQSAFFPREVVDEAIRIAMIDLGDNRFQLSDFKTKINK